MMNTELKQKIFNLTGRISKRGRNAGCKHAMICALLIILAATSAHVYASSYWRVEGINPWYLDYGDINMNGSTNVAGGYKDITGSGIGGPFKSVCPDLPDGDAPHSVWMWAEYFDPIVSVSGAYSLVKMNDYMNAGLSYEFQGSYHFPVSHVQIAPFGIECGQEEVHGSTSYSARIQITKPFIGSMSFNAILGRQCQGSEDGACTQHAEAWQSIGIRGNIIVPQSCNIVPGSTFDIDLGQISQKTFVQGGAGNRPTGFINRPLTVKVQCSGGVQTDALLKVRLEGAAASGYPQALTSDNPDIGVVITKPDGSTVLMPNDINSVIPMQLQDGQGNVVIQAYPISLTGKTPTVGVFTTMANLRFDFT
ncbi:fimbrial protein [Klebsiella aerogenes]|uniref:fimbrial protein n=1 Tax=Klebsiella aerogenes TaxID=548 RepID=UPI001F2621F8|nr:fimbrial protein [Klebsiella aerogenes]